jgi:DNA-3-methyladenine glycosylase II
MNAVRRLTSDTLRQGTRELAKKDPDLGRIVRRLGSPPMWGRRPGFATMIRIILEQQVSLAAAQTLYRRLTGHVGRMDPVKVHACGVDGLRKFGLTRQKARYCHELATRILEGRLDLSAVARGSDEDGRRTLLGVPGIGPWSADVYYLMALRRPDVWPPGDLALAVAIRDVKRLRELPTRDEQLEMARRWAPWRSVAARILWMHYLD